MLKKFFSDSGIIAALSLFCALVINIQHLKPQNNSFDEIFSNLEMKYGKEFRKESLSLRDSINKIDDITNRHFYLNKLFRITEQKDEISHIHSLIWKANTGHPEYAGLFEKAFKIAEKHKRLDDMCLVEYSRGNFFIARNQYDSAMIHILRYRDMTPESEKGEGYRNIINMLGDIYYHAGLYKQAKKTYYNLYQQYIKENRWNFYRPYVMMNNLGQIALKKGDYILAREWFNKSLGIAEQHLTTDYRINTLAYTKTKLAESYLKSDSLKQTDKILKEVEAYPENKIFEDVLQEYYFVKAQYFLKQNKAEEAKLLTDLLIPGDSLFYDEYRFIPEIYKLQSEIYFIQNNYPKAMQYRKKYESIKDSLKQQENIAQSMIILANRNHQKTRFELKKSKQKIIFLLSGSIVLLIILIFLLVLYRKLYRSKLELVRKSMQKAEAEKISTVEEIISENTNTDNKEAIRQMQLISELKVIMKTEKPFLDPGLKLNELADRLSTNRTYLSKAINNQLKTTFPNFVNEHRIREAIRLITSGYIENRTQEALAMKSGFSNRTVFISAFKKYTGVLPSFFIANYKKWDVDDKTFPLKHSGQTHLN